MTKAVHELFEMEGRVAIITGGGSGLGYDMAAALAEGSGDIASCKPSKPDVKEKIKQYRAEHPAKA